MLKTIASYTAPFEAYIAKGRLEAEGIPASIADEYYISANWTLSLAIGGVKLQVPEFYVAEALKIIKALDQGSYEESLFEEANQCPNCDSNEVAKVNWAWKSALVLFVLTIIVLPYSRHHYKCKNCSYSWIAKEQRYYPLLFILLNIILIFIIIAAIFLFLYYWRCKYIICPFW